MGFNSGFKGLNVKNNMDNYFEIFGIIAGPLKMGPIGCTETSVTTSLRCVTSQKSEDIVYTAGESLKSRIIWLILRRGD